MGTGCDFEDAINGCWPYQAITTGGLWMINVRRLTLTSWLICSGCSLVLKIGLLYVLS